MSRASSLSRGRLTLLTALAALLAISAAGQEPPAPIDIADTLTRAVAPEQISTTMVLFIVLTALSLAPAVLIMTTSFVRIAVVLGFLRQAMATQQSPPNQVIIGLSLFLTAFIMMPTYQRVFDEAFVPYRDGEFETLQGAYDAGIQPVRTFMFRQIRNPRDLALFIEIAGLPRPDTRADVPTHVLIPAFIISELRIAFQIGFLIYIPFLIIDMVVASTLMSMGMMMLPPVFVSLPFKIIMFVLADGWYLLIGSLVRSFD